MFMVIFGTVVEMNWISSKDRLERKQNSRVKNGLDKWHPVICVF
jgi:hypothetical protein